MSEMRRLKVLLSVGLFCLLLLSGCSLFNDDSNKSQGFAESPIWISSNKLLMLVENRTWIYEAPSIFGGSAYYYLDYQYPSLYQFDLSSESKPENLATFDNFTSGSYDYHPLIFCDYEQSRLFCKFYENMTEMNMTDYTISASYLGSTGDMNEDCTKIATILHDSFLVILDEATQRETLIDTILTYGRFYYIKYDWLNGNYAVGFPWQAYYDNESMLYIHDAEKDTTMVFDRNVNYFESNIAFRDIYSISFVPGSGYGKVEIEIEGYVNGETESRRFIYRYNTDNIGGGETDLSVKGIVSPDNTKYAYYDETDLVITDNFGNEINRVKVFEKTSPDL